MGANARLSEQENGMGMLKIGLVAALLLALVWFTLDALGQWRWAGRTEALLTRLEAARTEPAIARFGARELDGLPMVVQRYFRTALQEGSPIVTAASVGHTGRFNMGESADNWQPFTSRQRVVTRRPGFVWNGHMRMLPGVSVWVHDAYVAGEGILHPALFGLVTLMDLHDSEVVAHGELMRFFAEAAWYPTALLPSQGVRWAEVDERSAIATLTDGSLAITLTFDFGADGLIESVRAEARGRTVGKTTVMSPWEGRWTNYQLRDGMRVPISGEVAWITAEGRKPYWRGTITSLQYESAP